MKRPPVTATINGQLDAPEADELFKTVTGWGAPDGTKQCVIDLTDLNFMLPVGLTAVVQSAAHLKSIGWSPSVQFPEREDVRQYLARMGLRRALRGLARCVGSPRASRRFRISTALVELTPIRDTGDVDGLLDGLSDKVAGILETELGYSEADVGNFCNVLSELSRNIIDHSGAVGFVAAQRYTKSKDHERYALISVGDVGVGLRSTLGQRYPVDRWTDEQVLHHALQPETSRHPNRDSDHIGCTYPVLSRFPLREKAYDRGGSYGTGTYTAYVDAIGGKRRTATRSTVLRFEEESGHPVAVAIVALDAHLTGSQNENDKSLVAVVRCGEFSAVLGGDLSGEKASDYKDIESDVAPLVGVVDVYKVHHHGSRHSTNETWLETTRPSIGIISAGSPNSHGHPTSECLERLHTAGIRTYWTSEGAGAPPDPTFDTVAGNVLVETEPGSLTFTVSWGNGTTHTYSALGQSTGLVTEPAYVWSASSGSEVYHFANCAVVNQIAPANRREGSEPPGGRRLHRGCPIQ